MVLKTDRTGRAIALLAALMLLTMVAAWIYLRDAARQRAVFR